MAKSRAKGRSGWEDKTDCPAECLQQLLIEHLAKGDPVDIGNYAMMLFNRGENTVAPATPAAHWRAKGEPDPHDDRYNCERAKLTKGQLTKGQLTDDELANEFYMYDHRGGLHSMMWLGAAKDRIRWLSRALVKAVADNADYVRLHDKMSKLLSETVVALNGPEPEDTKWSWHNLPDLAGAAMKRLAGFDLPPSRIDERAEFEKSYAAAWSAESDETHTAVEIAALRNGDGYAKKYSYLNGKWEGWQARAELRQDSNLAAERPLTGKWHHGNGFLVCGTLNIARADFDTSPSEKVKNEVFSWICDTLNNANVSPFPF
jgi:hypothetical protein